MYWLIKGIKLPTLVYYAQQCDMHMKDEKESLGSDTTPTLQKRENIQE